MFANYGEYPIESANHANIPVDIWLTPVDESESDVEVDFVPKYSLTASNYMPRKGVVDEGAYQYYADNREELVELVNKHVMPLYKNASVRLAGICSGINNSLYYWSPFPESADVAGILHPDDIPEESLTNDSRVRGRLQLQEAVEAVRRKVCGYSDGKRDAVPCDCKFGVTIPLGIGGEQCGCPELRVIHAILGVMTDAELNTYYRRLNA